MTIRMVVHLTGYAGFALHKLVDAIDDAIEQREATCAKLTTVQNDKILSDTEIFEINTKT